MSRYTGNSDRNQWPKSELCSHYTLEHETFVTYLHCAGKRDAEIAVLLLKNFPNVIEVKPGGNPKSVLEAVAGWVGLRNSMWCPEVITDKETLERYSWGPAAFKEFGIVSAPQPNWGPVLPAQANPGSNW